MTDPDHIEQLEQLADEATRLIDHLRCSQVAPAVIAETSRHIQRAVQELAPHLQQGEGWSTTAMAHAVPGITWKEDDLNALMPFSPISGRRNPVAPKVRMWKDGDEVGGEAMFSATYAGPPDSVHGGIIAGVFDELLSMANVVRGTAGFTGTLTIRYHRKTPLNTPIELWACNDREEGRKLFCRAEFRVDGEVTASGEGVFINTAEMKKGLIRKQGGAE